MKNLRAMTFSRMGRLLLQIAALLFFANATMAFGACCIAELTASDNSTVDMPCHKKSGDEDDKTSAQNDCCSMCVQMMFVVEARIEPCSATQIAREDLTPLQVASGIDPPFRPPIAPLS